MAKQPTKKAAKKAATKVAAKKAAVAKAASAPAKASTPAPVASASPAAAKKAPVKKAAAKKVAVTKAPVKKPAAKKAAAKKAVSSLTTIVAKVDVGFGNSLYLRGEGGQLSWEKGVVMGCAGDDEWVWSSDAVEDQAEFKVVLNDEIWATGPNAFVAKGERIVIEPSF